MSVDMFLNLGLWESGWEFFLIRYPVSYLLPPGLGRENGRRLRYKYEFLKKGETILSPSKRHRKWNFGEKFFKSIPCFDKDFLFGLL